MERAWLNRLRQVIDETPGLDMKGLALKAGLDASAVQKWFKEGKWPRLDTFLRVCSAAGVSPGWLLAGEEPFRIDIPVVGIVSAGEGFVPTDDDGRFGPVHFDVGDANVIAIEVRGDSMAPVYRQGDTLICHRTAARHADNLVGRDCAVRTRNGEHYIKILKRGSRVGLFTLRSFNPAHEDIEDVQLDWAAPVAWVKRGGR